MPDPVRMWMAAQPVMPLPVLHPMPEPVGTRCVVAAEPVGLHVSMRRVMLRPAAAMLMVPMLAAGNVVLHRAVLDLAVTVLAGTPATRLPSLAPLVVMAPQMAFLLATRCPVFGTLLAVHAGPRTLLATRLVLAIAPNMFVGLAAMLAAALALWIVATGNRLPVGIVRVLALAAGNVHAMVGLAVVMPPEAVAVLDRIVRPGMLFASVLVRVGVLVMVGTVMLESLVRSVMFVTMLVAAALVMAFVMHLVMFGVADVLGMGMAMRGMVPLVLLMLRHVMALSVFVTLVGGVEFLGY